MKIIKQRCFDYINSFYKEFKIFYKNNNLLKITFSFPSNELGSIIESRLNNSQIEIYKMCLLGEATWIENDLKTEYHIYDFGVNRVLNRVAIEAIGECDYCKNNVQLKELINICNICQSKYDLLGNEIEPCFTCGLDIKESVENILLDNSI